MVNQKFSGHWSGANIFISPYHCSMVEKCVHSAMFESLVYEELA